MELFKDINNGKYNTILIVLIFILLFNLYCKQSNIENMEGTQITDTDIIDKIDTKYNMTSIRDLHEIYKNKILKGTFDKDCIVKGNVSIGPPDSKINMKYENDGLIFSNSNDDSTVLKIDNDYSIEVGENPGNLEIKYNDNVILDTHQIYVQPSLKTSLDDLKTNFDTIKNNITNFRNNHYIPHQNKISRNSNNRVVKEVHRV